MTEKSTDPDAPLRIAVESQSMVPPRSGIGRYAWELTRVIARQDGVRVLYFHGTHWLDRWIDMMPPPVRPEAGRFYRRSREIVPFGRHIRQAIDTIAFAFMARKKRIQIIFAPNYIGPDTSVPTVITVHDLSHIRYPETHPDKRVAFLNQALPKAIRKARKVLVVSQFTAGEVRALFPEAVDKIQVIYPGVENRFFSPPDAEAQMVLADLLHQDDRSYFLFLATLEPRKNLSRILSAYEQLPDKIRQAHPLVLAGRVGWRESKFAEPLARLVARREAFLLGFVPDNVLPALYRGALALLYPALYEGFGLPPVEAMAAGCPALVGNVTAMPEVCGDAALYCNPLDVDSIRDGMIRLAEDTTVREDLAQRGPQRASLYSWEKAGSELLTVLKEAARL
ncbi:glycosyltransferase family 4 protein [Acidithiobacillus ferridurans]|uniref:glycosyltransferase family 4 protein n=1 Tax=Acidithiobacillus ferridurans TaxID=1232575 RepID=UPI001C070E17|nr:glycosyltransferase family 1 protein [Acidithiobacillus ferridurans]MBU2805850.1 glycosyltransferase family 4 protein [Acidithiobacillus ferridurans]